MCFSLFRSLGLERMFCNHSLGRVSERLMLECEVNMVGRFYLTILLDATCQNLWRYYLKGRDLLGSSRFMLWGDIC